MSSRAKKREVVRLLNGQVEYSDATGTTMGQLPSLFSNQKYAWCDLARAVKSGNYSSLPDYVQAWCRREGLALPETGTFKLYDDVRDVIESATEWKGDKPILRTSPLHQDQTNLSG